MKKMSVQWLSYHCNIEHMFHVALEQLHDLEELDRVTDVFSFNAHSLYWSVSEWFNCFLWLFESIRWEIEVCVPSDNIPLGFVNHLEYFSHLEELVFLIIISIGTNHVSQHSRLPLNLPWLVTIFFNHRRKHFWVLYWIDSHNNENCAWFLYFNGWKQKMKEEKTTRMFFFFYQIIGNSFSRRVRTRHRGQKLRRITLNLCRKNLLKI